MCPNLSVVAYSHLVALRRADPLSKMWHFMQLQKENINLASMSLRPREREKEAVRGSEKVHKVCVSYKQRLHNFSFRLLELPKWTLYQSHPRTHAVPKAFFMLYLK